MRWSFRIGTVAGIRIEVHVTFLLMLGAYAWFTSTSPADAIRTTLDLLLLFGCVLLHELGHALAARRYGILTREIVLLPIGGVARLERMPERPVQELVVALAGPAVNVVLAIGLAGALYALHRAPASLLDAAATGRTLEFLLVANVAMILFNLIPAFPMDGGRVLRACLAMALPFARATRIASIVGQGFALVFALVGVFAFHNLLLVFIALFVFMAAGEERAVVQTRASLTGLPVSAAMVTSFVSLETRHELQHAVDLMLAGDQQDFPVLEQGELLGMLSRADLIRGLREEGAEAPVGRVARLDVQPVEASWPLERALQRMRASRQSAVPVVARGELVGLLTLENVGELLLVQEARQRRAGVA
ncbi:MAG TPA: site-2 protease family protein [Candidatus Eisenbacteria bacterium]|nr:site-2 protease family protein [Candidatus Eisenbacteria bacterium]